MKKSILISICLVAAFFFAGTTNVAAQWSASVSWNDYNCSCGSITKKEIKWEIRKVSDNSLFSKGTKDVTSLSSPQTIGGPETPVEDLLYNICAEVLYYDASIDPCCEGVDCEYNVDWEDLANGNVSLYITMN